MHAQSSCFDPASAGDFSLPSLEIQYKAPNTDFSGGGEEQLPQVTFLWITGLSLRFIDNCMILVVLVGKKVFVYIHIYIFKKRLNIQDEMLFLS